MQTTDYSLFSFLPYNRDVNLGLVNRLKSAIVAHGYLPSKSILVDKEMNIIDGQHRFTACKELGLPIHFDIYEGGSDTKSIILVCNNNQLIWRLNNHIECHAKNGIECYQKLVDFETVYKLGTSNNLIILPEKSSLKPNDIRNGKHFIVNDKCFLIANFIKEAKVLSFYKEKNFVTAVRKLFDKANEAQISKVSSSILAIKKQADPATYLVIFENIINKGTSKNKIVF